ncbi:MAG: hydrogenobyrinic acid a,c-diamide synthase (glutamine-hydrolyzing) [Firmicutes bacterium]|nr:hydrogenobyrinic acid a,c-diamide synthase (glutamine-hydrolyzing) [Bacillota bacterium]
MTLPRVVISAPHRSSGKTTLTIGLCAALAESGFKVQPFKKGPDYIDPMWHTTATGRNCRNLDFFMMGEENIRMSFLMNASDADISIIEGNMGLYDGMEVDGRGSTADLARLLKVPVILILDTSNMTRSVAPLIQGFKNFEPDIYIAGIILNKVSGSRHESKLRAAIERYCDVEVVGAVPNSSEIGLVQRHLGLKPAREDEKAVAVINSVAELVKNYVDLEKLIQIARTAPELPSIEGLDLIKPKPKPAVKIGIAMDQAFTFYYPENIDALEMAGAELIPFSPLRDKQLPAINGLYIGGGFPEVFMDELESNTSIREEIKKAIGDGMPVYAECGGLMYLARGISWNGKTREMVGGLPCDIFMHKKPKGHGYVRLKTTGDSWLTSDLEVKGHEFHYSEVKNLSDVRFAYRVLRGKGVDGLNDGIVYKNVLASYTHLHSAGFPIWAEKFIAYVKDKGYGF